MKNQLLIVIDKESAQPVTVMNTYTRVAKFLEMDKKELRKIYNKLSSKDEQCVVEVRDHYIIRTQQNQYIDEKIRKYINSKQLDRLRAKLDSAGDNRTILVHGRTVPVVSCPDGIGGLCLD